MIYGFNANEVFQIGIEIEENGRLFYEKAQAIVDKEEVKEIFRSLARAEVEHRERFTAWKAALPDSSQEETVWDPDNETDRYLKMMADMHVFHSRHAIETILPGIHTAEDALRLAIQFEKDSIIFFLAMQEATEGKKGQQLISQLVEEEKNHLKTLSTELRKIQPLETS